MQLFSWHVLCVSSFFNCICTIFLHVAGESCNISDKRSFWSSPVANNQGTVYACYINSDHILHVVVSMHAFDKGNKWSKCTLISWDYSRKCVQYIYGIQACHICTLIITVFQFLNYFKDILDGVASHAMVVIGNYLWLYGGLSLSKGPMDTLARYFQQWNISLIILQEHTVSR